MADPTNITSPGGVHKGAADAPAGFKPYVSPDLSPPEFTLKAVVVGSALGILFGASSLYLVLKVGLTVSASIPVAGDRRDQPAAGMHLPDSMVKGVGHQHVAGPVERSQPQTTDVGARPLAERKLVGGQPGARELCRLAVQVE